MSDQIRTGLDRAAAEQFQLLLARNGWRPAGENKEIYRRWSPQSDELKVVGPDESSTPLMAGARNILVPLNDALADFDELLQTSIETFLKTSALEGKDIQALQSLLDNGSRLDAEVSFAKDSRVSGRIEWDAGRSLWASAEQSLLAAAKAQISSAPYYGNRYGQFAQRFLAACEMGLGRAGSYVVTTYAPTREVFPERHTRPSTGYVVPIHTGLDVLTTLTGALKAAQAAADTSLREGGNVAVFKDAVSEGVSRELTDALTHLVARGTDGSVRISWPLGTKDASAAADVEEIAFEAQHFEVLSRASESLARTEDSRVVTAEGWVKVTSRPSRGQPGTIRMSVYQGSDASTLTVTLNDAQFDEAMSAVTQQEGLAITGSQVRVGQRYSLEKVTNVSVKSMEAIERESAASF